MIKKLKFIGVCLLADTSSILKCKRALFFDKFYRGIYTVIIQKMDFSIDNITNYLHPNLVRDLYGYTETNKTYIIKKYHGCTKRIFIM